MQAESKFHVECINPILNVKDIQTSLHFYVDLLGFSNAEWGTEEFTCVTRDKSGIYLCRGKQGQRGTWIWLGIDGNISELYEELKRKGVKILMPPTNFTWALELNIEDPDGHVIRLGTDPDPALRFADQ